MHHYNYVALSYPSSIWSPVKVYFVEMYDRFAHFAFSQIRILAVGLCLEHVEIL